MKLLFSLILFAANSFAGTTATLHLKGTVASLITLEIAPESVSTALPMEQPQTNLKVASVTEKSNSGTGYKVSITSQNRGKLVKDATNYVTYNLTYGGISANLNGVTEVSYSGRGVSQKDVKITYSGTENLAAGDYTDSVTITIQGN